MAAENEDSKAQSYIKSLQAEIAQVKAEKAAMREEFGKDLNPQGDEEKLLTVDDIVRARDRLLPEALATMKELLLVGESEALRWTIAKYVISSKLSELRDDEKDDFAKLLDELSNRGRASAQTSS